MPRYIAFLRAINVGGRVVTMERLRALFEAEGFSAVDTFIASGNVIFQSRSKDPARLERQIEVRLARALGYQVATFIRTEAEFTTLLGYEPFARKAVQSAGSFNVGFLRSPLAKEAERKLAALKSPIDDFHVNGREIYWLCATRQSESTFSNMVFERTTGAAATFRGMNTIRKLGAKHGFSVGVESGTRE